MNQDEDKLIEFEENKKDMHRASFEASDLSEREQIKCSIRSKLYLKAAGNHEVIMDALSELSENEMSQLIVDTILAVEYNADGMGCISSHKFQSIGERVADVVMSYMQGVIDSEDGPQNWEDIY